MRILLNSAYEEVHIDLPRVPVKGEKICKFVESMGASYTFEVIDVIWNLNGDIVILDVDVYE